MKIINVNPDVHSLSIPGKDGEAHTYKVDKDGTFEVPHEDAEVLLNQADWAPFTGEPRIPEPNVIDLAAAEAKAKQGQQAVDRIHAMADKAGEASFNAQKAQEHLGDLPAGPETDALANKQAELEADAEEERDSKRSPGPTAEMQERKETEPLVPGRIEGEEQVAHQEKVQEKAKAKVRRRVKAGAKRIAAEHEPHVSGTPKPQ